MRVAIWKGKDNMLDEPDIVLNDCDTLTGKGYEYEIGWTDEDDTDEMMILYIYYNGKLASEHRLKEITDNFYNW